MAEWDAVATSQIEDAAERGEIALAQDDRNWIKLMIAAGLAIGLCWMVFLHTYRLDDPDIPAVWQYGFEEGTIARSLAHGHGFSSPFEYATGRTGPTAWVAPLYPALAALVFRELGDFGPAPTFALMLLNIIFFALTCVPIYLLARRCFGRPVALAAGFAWAAIPYFDRWYRWIWDTNLTALLLVVLLWGTAELAGRNHAIKWWVGYGVLWGFAALTNPVVVSVLPFAMAWLGWRQRRHCSSVRPVLFAGIAFLAVIAPWLARNYVVFHQPVFLRSNLGVELRLTNIHGHDQFLWEDYHPSVNPDEALEYVVLGEVRYCRYKMQQAIQFVRTYPREFIWLTWERVKTFWNGEGGTYLGDDEFWQYKVYVPLSVLSLAGMVLAVVKRRPAAWLMVAVMVFFPAVYYVTYPATRYRYPMEPVMLVLASYFVAWAIQVIKGKVSSGLRQV